LTSALFKKFVGFIKITLLNQVVPNQFNSKREKTHFEERITEWYKPAIERFMQEQLKEVLFYCGIIQK
jgi:hypothetical protein|tara:strand:- start:964 stop:1167 length:204 start_codon:yes stop_codon:yes gene_type:complete